MNQAQCPKCKAALPRRGQFCVECGFDLYADGVRRRPVPWLSIIAIPVVVAGVLAVLIIGPCKSESVPEVEVVIEQTKDLLRLLGEKHYGEVVDRFLKANGERFSEAEEKLRQIARGDGAQGIKNAQSHGFRNQDEAFAYVRKHVTRHPEYVAKLLYTIVSHPEPNPWLSPRRADRFFEWYVEQEFGRAEVAKAQLGTGGARWEEGALTVSVRYPEPPKVLPGVADPGVLRWRLVSGAFGGCSKQRAVLDYGGEAEDHLGEFLDFLKRLPAE